MFLCSECDPCGGSIFDFDDGNCLGLPSRGRCEGCGRGALCTDCHSGKPVRRKPSADLGSEEGGER